MASDPLNTWGTYAVGHSLWTAAPELIDCLVHTLPPAVLRGRHVIELGAGLGTVGIVRICRWCFVSSSHDQYCVAMLNCSGCLEADGVVCVQSHFTCWAGTAAVFCYAFNNVCRPWRCTVPV